MDTTTEDRVFFVHVDRAHVVWYIALLAMLRSLWRLVIFTVVIVAVTLAVVLRSNGTDAIGIFGETFCEG